MSLQVAFYKGFFRYSMPVFRKQNAGPIAILRMDGDMYESTMGTKKYPSLRSLTHAQAPWRPCQCMHYPFMGIRTLSRWLDDTSFCVHSVTKLIGVLCADVLFNAYDRVPVGGYCIVDDWLVPECQKAVKEFFDMHGGQEKVHEIDHTSVWWQKSRAAPLQHQWYRQFNMSRGSET
jgi:Macrocin-O-methyltransferase (TylF)